MKHSTDHKMNMSDKSDISNYHKLAHMLGLSFIAMYILMYAMVDSLPNVFSSYNQFYMAGLMTMPMIIIEILVMGAMYQNKKLNTFLLGAGIILGVSFFVLIRQQTFIGDKQFVRSMIPHHGGAVLMCENANLQDLELKDFCANIIKGQNGEIEQMKRILERLNR